LLPGGRQGRLRRGDLRLRHAVAPAGFVDVLLGDQVRPGLHDVREPFGREVRHLVCRPGAFEVGLRAVDFLAGAFHGGFVLPDFIL
jgi:hypothetical protein